jgi:hypothetical protein
MERTFQTNPPNLEPLNIRVGEIAKAEVVTTIGHLKNGKAGGIDNISPQVHRRFLGILSPLSVIQDME